MLNGLLANLSPVPREFYRYPTEIDTNWTRTHTSRTSRVLAMHRRSFGCSFVGVRSLRWHLDYSVALDSSPGFGSPRTFTTAPSLTNRHSSIPTTTSLSCDGPH